MLRPAYLSQKLDRPLPTKDGGMDCSPSLDQVAGLFPASSGQRGPYATDRSISSIGAPRTSPGGTGRLPWTHRAEVVADDDAQQEGQAPGPRIVHCLGSCGLTNSSPHARLPIRPRATPGPDTTISHRHNL